MGMRRLSIIDREGGSQPIFNEDDTVVVVFNGEIYNYRELRGKLTAAGHSFETDCDTEVLVHAWEEYGEKMPKYLDGMFAFSIFDEKDESVFLARDRVGIKPLYYVYQDKQLYWASEIKPLLRTKIDTDLDEQAIYNYFNLRYFPWPQTPFEQIQKVPPGTSLLYQDGEITTNQFWTLEPANYTGDISSAATKFQSIFEESVTKRLMTDVPLGAFLSGGLDSSSIVAIMSKKLDHSFKTFSVGFADDTYDESDEAAFVADYFGTDHHQITVDLSSMDLFGDIVEQYGEPLADPAALPTLALSKYASEHVKVVLSGEGADELFGGYWYTDKIPSHQQKFRALPDFMFELAEAIEPYSPVLKQPLRYFSALKNNETAMRGVLQQFDIPVERYIDVNPDQDRDNLSTMINQTKNQVHENEFDKRMTAYDITHWLPDNLLYKVDQSSMAASLEARVPFLDHELVEFAYGIPTQFKQDGYKPVINQAMKDILPKRVRDRKKHGFSVPIAEWFRQDHYAIVKWFSYDKLNTTPYINASRVHNIWTEHKKGNDNSQILWKILMYVAWYHKVVEEDS
jgi:asparagine synthase (glutamine-hydrolysing)